MKILCKDNMITDEEYQPDAFTKEDVENILDELFDALRQAFDGRYREPDYNIDNIHFEDFYMSCEVRIDKKGRTIASGKFEFIPYHDYWDTSDYQQHLATTIKRFVRSLQK